MAQRTVDSHAAFFRAYLRPGFHLLDCGCGPGTITLGFAPLISPGLVTGVDLEASQIQVARERSVASGLSNLRFQVSSIYELPFANHCFDAAFSHAVMEHLQQPVKALQELHRVLKPGGVVGLRSPDWGGFLLAPASAELEEALAYYKQIQQRNGGDPYIGRQLGALLRQAGFTNIKVSASYQCYENLSLIAEYLALQIEASDSNEQSNRSKENAGSSRHQSCAEMGNTLRAWSQHRDSWFAQAWCEAVAYKA
ncbi:methyltransferase domain-containing protein [Leptolyngbya sp. FACHB-261]|uniref:methyltransferase domain-containing protein n=1 Tax=Leptolyngbya sp. FACHB-261 TaxID=2692806 RepID=UPI001688674F|nr:methyltransferase domain-containing protein [Leptolyngbya sp. FACHB-261]